MSYQSLLFLLNLLMSYIAETDVDLQQLIREGEKVLNCPKVQDMLAIGVPEGQSRTEALELENFSKALSGLKSFVNNPPANATKLDEGLILHELDVAGEALRVWAVHQP